MVLAFENDVPMNQHRDLVRRAGPIPDARLEGLTGVDEPSLVVRSPASSTSSSASQITSCTASDTTGVCERNNSGNNATIPIVLGVVIPLTVAFVVLIILHRRHVKKLRREDAEDADRSLDFGLDGSPRKGGKKSKKIKKKGQQLPEMSAADAVGAVRGDRGISMDLGQANPYLLPPELQQSRESLHSLSRTLNTGDDRYRVTSFVPDDGSIRSPSSLKNHWDDASTIHTTSHSTRGLLPQPPIKITEPLPTGPKPYPKTTDNHALLAPGFQDTARDSYMSTTSINGNVAALRASNNYLGQFISGGNKGRRPESPKKDEVITSVTELEGSAPIITEPHPAFRNEPSKRQSVALDFQIPPTTHESLTHQNTTYHEMAAQRDSRLPQLHVTPSDNETPKRQSFASHDVSVQPNQQTNINQLVTVDTAPEGPLLSRTSYQPEQRQSKLLQTGTETPQDRESYYEDDEPYDMEDYADILGYDPRMSTMGTRPLPPDDPSENPEERALKIRSFYKEYFDESGKAGSSANRVSYYDGSENYVDDYYRNGSRNGSPAMNSRQGPPPSRGPLRQHRATVSNGTPSGYGPRAYSSASGPTGPPRPQPKKNLPPPGPLMVLPAPSKLTEDSMLPNAIDYAPPQVFKNQRAGTPDSMKGGKREYSPGPRSYTPLVSSFDDLSALPSPHALRKSGTFTSLDFAPPRFSPSEGQGSETGSIRSTRSGVSAMHQQNIRNGAYRVSRIPKEAAGTKDEMFTSLRPQWDMNR